MNKVTFDDIVRAKMQREKDKLTVKPVSIPSIGKELVFKMPSDEMVLGFIDAISEDESTSNMVREFGKIIYLCCGDLQDTKLHEELEVVDPFSVVGSFMDANDVMVVGDAICSMNSLYKNFGSEVKKS